LDKNEKYNLLTAQVRSLAAGETNHVGLLANVAAAMTSTETSYAR